AGRGVLFAPVGAVRSPVGAGGLALPAVLVGVVVGPALLRELLIGVLLGGVLLVGVLLVGVLLVGVLLVRVLLVGVPVPAVLVGVLVVLPAVLAGRGRGRAGRDERVRGRVAACDEHGGGADGRQRGQPRIAAGVR